MGTWAQQVLNQVDSIGNGALQFSTGLLSTTPGQMVIIGFGLMIFGLIIYVIVRVFTAIKWR